MHPSEVYAIRALPKSCTQDELKQTILDALAQFAHEIDAGVLDPDVNFRDQAELDSVDYLNLMLQLERRLGLHIPEQDYPRLSCLSGALGYVGAFERGAAR
jgi:acyl carrier protein